jgi:hypothetical protein
MKKFTLNNIYKICEFAENPYKGGNAEYGISLFHKELALLVCAGWERWKMSCSGCVSNMAKGMVYESEGRFYGLSEGYEFRENRLVLSDL